MKAIFIWSVLTFLAVCNTYAQEKHYEFNRLNTRKQTLKGQSTSEIYVVSCLKTEASLNPEYTKLKSELEKVITDSISKSADYYKALDRFNDISTVKSKVLAFNSSRKSFRNKVTFLKEAQILASKHKIKDLFYSDNYINKGMKAGFLLLSLNPENMKAHLNKILLKLDNKIKVPEKPTYELIAALREKLSNTKKTKDIKNLKNKKGYALQNNIVPPEEITGDFSVLGEYFVLNRPTNRFLKDQLISKNTVLNLRIAKEKLYTKEERVLIQNNRTKEMYLVDNSFLNGFSVKS
ncbi:hypothetical protein Q4Q34_04660 [Flavivirga abyssicola]|uniref:hypothetical protein n=1 Tax=Flavivirga abyssicola TaxID=3063533 RepID=UPI0026DF6FE8|nr:hypothetical protein [Flavivirga sp. MEBiC07777]WVK14318.1 hypothetical protein Q4Q34_04660 [Flavivirga sp. MEBiC07777]